MSIFFSSFFKFFLIFEKIIFCNVFRLFYALFSSVTHRRKVFIPPGKEKINSFSPTVLTSPIKCSCASAQSALVKSATATVFSCNTSFVFIPSSPFVLSHARYLYCIYSITKRELFFNFFGQNSPVCFCPIRTTFVEFCRTKIFFGIFANFYEFLRALSRFFWKNLHFTAYNPYSSANFLNSGNAFSIRSVCTQYAIRTQPLYPKSAPLTSNNSYFFARSQNAAASSSAAFTNR